MAFEKAIQALSDLETKLRRAFNLAGPISARLDPVLSPVMIAGDLREPGHAVDRGRSFVYTSTPGNIAGAPVYLTQRFNRDVLIEALYCPPLLLNGTNVQAYLTVPGQTPAQAITRVAGAWRDGKLSDGDTPPIEDSGAAPAALGGGTAESITRTVCIWFGTAVIGQPSGDQGWRPVQVHVPAGGCLNWRFGSNWTGGGIMIAGRIWT